MPLKISLPIERLLAFIAIAARNSGSCPMRSMTPTISASASLVTRTIGLLKICKLPRTSLYIDQTVHFLQLFEIRAFAWPRERSGVLCSMLALHEVCRQVAAYVVVYLAFPLQIRCKYGRIWRAGCKYFVGYRWGYQSERCGI